MRRCVATRHTTPTAFQRTSADNPVRIDPIVIPLIVTQRDTRRSSSRAALRYTALLSAADLAGGRSDVMCTNGRDLVLRTYAKMKSHMVLQSPFPASRGSRRSTSFAKRGRRRRSLVERFLGST